MVSCATAAVQDMKMNSAINSLRRPIIIKLYAKDTAGNGCKQQVGNLHEKITYGQVVVGKIFITRKNIVLIWC